MTFPRSLESSTQSADPIVVQLLVRWQSSHSNDVREILSVGFLSWAKLTPQYVVPCFDSRCLGNVDCPGPRFRFRFNLAQRLDKLRPGGTLLLIFLSTARVSCSWRTKTQDDLLLYGLSAQMTAVWRSLASVPDTPQVGLRVGIGLRKGPSSFKENPRCFL